MNVTTLRTYSNAEHDALIEATEKELLSYVTLEGKHHGKQNKPNNLDELYALAHNPITAKIQSVLYITQEKFLPISGMAAANSIRTEAQEQAQKVEGEKNEKEHTLQALEARPKLHIPNSTKRRLRPWVLGFIILAAGADGLMVYDSARYAGMGRFAACIAALAITAAVIATVHILGGYIARAVTRKSKFVRLCVALLGALAFFYFINTFRAASVAETAQLQIDPDAAQIQSTASPIAFTAISFALFAAALLLAVRISITKEEQRSEQEYLTWQQEVQRLKNEIAKHEAEIEHIRTEAIQKATDAIRIYEYALTCEQRLEAIARLGLAKYIESALRHLAGATVHSFMAHPPAFEFITIFQNKNVQK